MSHAPLTGPHVEAQSGTAKSLVILIHGYGANGDDLIDIGNQLAPHFPDTAFSSPHAPEDCPMSPGGKQWFPLTHNPGGFRPEEEYWNGVTHSEDVLNNYIDAELERLNLDESQCVLLGFSQGTMMSLHVGLRRKKQLAGVIGFSGVLAGEDRLKDDIQSKPPVLIVHGEDDPVIPVEAVPRATKALRGVDIDAEWHIVAGLGHGIEQMGLMLAANFLRRTL